MKTINTIVDTFVNMTDENKQKHLDAVSYIKKLAAITNTNISTWDIGLIFKDYDHYDCHILTEKKDINKKFFEKLSSVVDKVEEDEISVLSDESLSKIFESFNRICENQAQARINNAKYALETTKRRTLDAFNAFNDYMKKYHKEIQALASHGNSLSVVEKLKSDLDKVLKEGNWVNPVLFENKLYLNTKNDVNCSLVNRQAGIDITVNFGKLSAVIDLNTLDMTVIPFKNNIGYNSPNFSGFGGTSGTLYHPHVSPKGQICWGTALSTYQENIEQFNFADNLKLLYSLLHVYNDGNPYASIATFKEEGKKNSRWAEQIRHPSKKKDVVTETLEAQTVASDNATVQVEIQPTISIADAASA